MTVKLIRRENRLLKMLAKSGGVLAQDAIASADSNLEGIREQTAAEVDRVLAELRLTADRATAPDGEPAARRELYAHANVIAGIAACGGLGHVGAAAYQLCELLDRYEVLDVWNPEAVVVHVQAIALLRSQACAADERAAGAVLAGLAELFRHASAVTPGQALL